MLQAYNGYFGANLSVQYEEEVVVEPGEQGMFEQSNQYGSQYSWREFEIDVPAGMSTLNVSISGGSGDADLYVRYGSAPTGSSFDCRPYKNGNNELCIFSTPQAGKWYIRLRGYTSYSGVNVFAEWK
jgi:serine protease